MQIQSVFLAMLLSAGAAAQPLSNVEVKGNAPKAVTAESTDKPVVETLAEIIPEDWTLIVPVGAAMPDSVHVEGNVGWLANLDQVGRSANMDFKVDARRKVVTMEQHSAFASAK